MGKQIHLEKIEALFDKSPVVEFKSIERIIERQKIVIMLNYLFTIC